MNPAQFKAWRKSLGLKQKDAAEKLGLKKRMIQYYETGKRDGKKVVIPKAIRLACYALAAGVEEYDGTPAVDAFEARRRFGRDAAQEGAHPQARSRLISLHSRRRSASGRGFRLGAFQDRSQFGLRRAPPPGWSRRRPGKRASRSSLRSEMRRFVPSMRVRVTPASRMRARW